MKGDSYNIGTTMGGTNIGRMSDTFSSYPTIFDGYSSSKNRARAYNFDDSISYGWKTFILNENGGPTTVVYGTNLTDGQYEVKYEHLENGGFRSNSFLSRTY